MTRYLFVAEKPSLMRDVEKVYKKYKTEIDDYLHGEIIFVALAGHVCGFATPDRYPEWNKKWYQLVNELPLIPRQWEIVINDSTKKLYEDIVHVFYQNSCNALIVGTDADVEGNGIFHLLEQKAGWNDIPALRFFPDDQTEKGIKKAFLSMQNYRTNPRDVHMTECFMLRSKYDWLLGMNLTIGVSVQQGTLMKIGRVKAPTLKMIYDNCKAIDEFVPTISYTVMAEFEPGFHGTMVDDEYNVIEFSSQKDAEQFIRSVLADKGVVLKSESKIVKTAAPRLYNLSDLQIEAGAKYGYTPDKTLSIVQSLYENHKVMSYPRTDGRYISTEKVKELPEIIQVMKNISELSNFASGLTEHSILDIKSKKTYVNDKEVSKSSHDALLPTHIAPNFGKMNQDEINIYMMVAKRLLSIFLPALEEYKSQLIIQIDGNNFKCQGSSVKDKGWTELVPKQRTVSTSLPKLKEGDVIPVNRVYPHEKTTTPPKRFTESTLIQAMVNISSRFSNKEYKDIMKEESGIGTQASRATIIKDLKDAGYFNVKKQGIYITELGKRYITCLSGFDVISPELTANMELHMKHVREGSERYEDVKTIMFSNVNQMVAQVKSIKERNKIAMKERCPICHSPMSDTMVHIECDSQNCGFKIPKRIAGVILPDAAIKDILIKQRTELISGFHSKTPGKTFAARLVLRDGKLEFSYDSECNLTCPICGRRMKKYNNGYGCSGYSLNQCNFFAYNEIAGVPISEQFLQDLFKKGISPVINGFRSKTGKPFHARLWIDKEEGKIKFRFDERETKYQCPNCNAPIHKFSWGYACSNKGQGCDFSLSQTIAGVTLSDKDMDSFFTQKQTPLIKGFFSKKGKRFSARLVWDPIQKKMVFRFS